MITLVDKRFEKFSLSRDGVLAVPVTITSFSDGKLSVECYRKTKSIIKRWLHEYRNCEMTNEAFAILTARLNLLMKKYSLVPDRYENAIIKEYLLSEIPDFSHPNCTILKTSDEIAKYKSETSVWNFKIDGESETDVVCAYIEDETILAYASVNSFGDGCEICPEINVETAKDHRKKGYASLCVKALSSYLLNVQKCTGIIYKCREENTASCRVAESCGFKLISRSRSFVYTR